ARRRGWTRRMLRSAANECVARSSSYSSLAAIAAIGSRSQPDQGGGPAHRLPLLLTSPDRSKHSHLPLEQDWLRPERQLVILENDLAPLLRIHPIGKHATHDMMRDHADAVVDRVRAEVRDVPSEGGR